MPASATLLDRFAPAADEAAARPSRTTSLDVLDATPKSESEQPWFCAPGTAIVYVARKGSGALDEVRAVLQTAGAGAGAFFQKMQAQYEKSAGIPDGEIVDRMRRAPVFADICYGGRPLNKGVFLPDDLDLVFSVFPYNGGRLAREGFTLVEHYQPGSAAAMEALVVRTEPLLTPAERAALRLMGDDQLHENIGPSLKKCDTTWWVVAAVVGATVALTFAITCTAIVKAEEVRLSEEEISKLGPAASARKLLALRHDALIRRARW
jgi:hypothetical protein